MIYSVYSLDRFFIYTIVSCNSVKNGLIYILYCFMYIYVCDIVCQHETLINYKNYNMYKFYKESIS